MCGIYACVSHKPQKPSDKLQGLLRNRGPDHLGHESCRVDIEGELPWVVSCTSTVLALRGGEIVSQPFVDPNTRSLFCWNGEAWRIDERNVAGNDGRAIFAALCGAASEVLAVDAIREILKVLRSISGPFAFFFLDTVHSEIYFGRDRLGRRSLLCKRDGDSLEFASISDSLKSSWFEVEADGIYHESLKNWPYSDLVEAKEQPEMSSLVAKHSWDEDKLNPSLGIFNKTVPHSVALGIQSEPVQALRTQLRASLELRILNVPVPPGLDQTHNVRTAILFSGGLDCTVLARMAHDILPVDQHIDLLNVAFENPRVIQAAKNDAATKKGQLMGNPVNGIVTQEDEVSDLSPFEKCPDRETGRKAFQELQVICPDRTWRFVAVDIPYAETIAHRDTVISLIHPHNTEMDLSIANALYFASRGVGVASDQKPETSTLYSTPARVLLSGLGADELFGGYTRHSTAFNRHGYQGLIDELELDVNRLGKRNLGRDDRVISYWGKEARFPFLDESLVKWAVESPIDDKCGFTLDKAVVIDDQGIEPEKKVLRLLAYSLGMHSVAHEKKRAIQFGARTAKMEVGRVKGTQKIS